MQPDNPTPEQLPTTAVPNPPPEQQLATPDITNVQALAVGQAIVALAVALGFDMSPEKEHSIIALSVAIGVILPIADAIIRHGRATGTALRNRGEKS